MIEFKELTPEEEDEFSALLFEKISDGPPLEKSKVAEVSKAAIEFSVLSDTEALNEEQTLEPGFRTALAVTLKALEDGIDPGLLAETWASAVNDNITEMFTERATEILWNEAARAVLDPRSLASQDIESVVSDHLGGVCAYGDLLEGLAYVALSSDQDPIAVVGPKLMAERAEHLSEGALVHLRNGLLNLLLSTAGPLVAVAKSPFDRTKMWLSMRDDKVRTAHALTDGQTVPTSGVFTTGGSFARYPGDPKLPAALRINCRCRMIPGGADPKVYLANGPRPRIPTGPSHLAARDAVEAAEAEAKAAAKDGRSLVEDAFQLISEPEEFRRTLRTLSTAQRLLLGGAVLAAVAFIFKDGNKPTRAFVANSVGMDPLLTVNELSENPNEAEVTEFLTAVFFSRHPGVLTQESLYATDEPEGESVISEDIVQFGREIHDPRTGKLLGSRRGEGRATQTPSSESLPSSRRGTGRAIDVPVGVTQAGTPRIRDPQPALQNAGGRARRKANQDIEAELSHSARRSGEGVEFDHNGGRVKVQKTDDAPGHSQGGDVSLDGENVGKLWRHERADPNGMFWQVNPPIREDAPWGTPSWVKTPMDGVDMLVAQQQVYELERDAEMGIEFGREIHDVRTGKLLGSRSAGKIAAIKQGFTSSQAMHTNPGWKEGDPLSEKYTPERAALHEQILAEDLAKGKAQVDPVAVFMGGGPASGKSTLLDSGLVTLPESPVTVDNDDMKTRLPEYKLLGDLGDKTMAGFVHEEASDLAKMLTARALAMNSNVVIDGTGDSGAGKMIGKIEAARLAGHRVEGVYVSTGVADAEARNVQRYENLKARGEVPRMVAPRALRETHVQVSRIFPKVSEHFDSVRLYSTEGNTKPTDPPRLMAEATRGHPLTVTRPSDYSSFIAKGDVTGPAFTIQFGADAEEVEDRVDVDVLLASVLNGTPFDFPESNRQLFDELVGSVADMRQSYPDAVIEIPSEMPAVDPADTGEKPADTPSGVEFGREIHDVRSGKLLGSKRGGSKGNQPYARTEDKAQGGGLRGALHMAEVANTRQIDALKPGGSTFVRLENGKKLKVTRGKTFVDPKAMGKATTTYKVGMHGAVGSIRIHPDRGLMVDRFYDDISKPIPKQTFMGGPIKTTGQAVQALADSYVEAPQNRNTAGIRMAIEDELEV